MFVQYAELAILLDQREGKSKYDVIRISWFPFLCCHSLVHYETKIGNISQRLVRHLLPFFNSTTT